MPRRRCFGEDDPAVIRLSGPEPEMTRLFRVMVHEDMQQLTRTVTVIEWLRDVIGRDTGEVLGRNEQPDCSAKGQAAVNNAE